MLKNFSDSNVLSKKFEGHYFIWDDHHVKTSSDLMLSIRVIYGQVWNWSPEVS